LHALAGKLLTPLAVLAADFCMPRQPSSAVAGQVMQAWPRTPAAAAIAPRWRAALRLASSKEAYQKGLLK
jgi:hypothetical protein